MQPTDKKDRCPLPAKDKAPIHERRAMGRGKETMNLLFDNYIVRLSTLVPSLTESDLQICCFIKLGIANPGIADLLGIESTSVSKRKLRLKERITQKIGAFGKGQTLDLWLWEF